MKHKISPNHTRRLSEVVIEFGEPLLAPSQDRETYEKNLELVIQLWNLQFAKQSEREEIIWKARQLVRLRAGGHSAPLQEALVADLVRVRAEQYGADQRAVYDWKLDWKKDGPRLEIASMDLSPQPPDPAAPPGPDTT